MHTWWSLKDRGVKPEKQWKDDEISLKYVEWQKSNLIFCKFYKKNIVIYFVEFKCDATCNNINFEIFLS